MVTWNYSDFVLYLTHIGVDCMAAWLCMHEFVCLELLTRSDCKHLHLIRNTP